VDVTVFEADDALGGQWHTTAANSGVWPGMRANTSRAMTAFSDFPAPAEHPLHPAAEQVRAYLEAHAHAFGVVDRLRFNTRVADVRPGGRSKATSRRTPWDRASPSSSSRPAGSSRCGAARRHRPTQRRCGK
jgi:cation diffusion facilitator CzcD-associated flavoprotein CzcO